SLIKSKMKETGAPLAGEMSGHIFFKHRWYGFDDALYAAVRLIEAVSQSGRSLTELKDAMPNAVATPELRFQVDEARKFAVIDEVRERLSADGAKVDATDGVRVSTSEGWWLLRASNTQDVLVARAEAKDEAGNARAEQRAFEAAGHEPRERAEARLSKQRADLIEAKTRIGEGAREQVEAPRHQASAEQRNDRPRRAADQRGGGHAAAQARGPASNAEPCGKPGAAAEHESFECAGDPRRRVPEQ